MLTIDDFSHLEEYSGTVDLLGLLTFENEDVSIATIGFELEAHQVVMALKLANLTAEEGLLSVGVSCKFSICSDEDRYKKEVGESIALGRSVRTNNYDSVIQVSEDIEDSTLNTLLMEVIVARIKKLQDMLIMRDDIIKFDKTLQQRTFQALGESLKEFK